MAAFRFQEKPRSQGGSWGNQRREYTCIGLIDGGDVKASAYSLTDAAILGPEGFLYRQDIDVQPVSTDHWDVTVSYGPRNREEGSYTITFDTTGGTHHMDASYETIATFPSGPPLDPPDAPDHRGAIGVHSSGGSLSVDGVDLVHPSLKINVEFSHPLGVITIEQIKAIARATGKVSESEFLGFEAGEVLFIGAQGREGTEQATTVNYSFICEENATVDNPLTIGWIEDIVKDGHDYLWVAFTETVDADQRPIKEPAWVYVERVYKRADLASVLGFG